MPIAKSTGCSMEDAGYMAVYRLKALTIGIGSMVGVLRKAVSAQ
ncbi:hypothetical protein [Polynucleobacter sp. AP-Capit-er-40B-B4]|nr:hypothetical protein [Polynucleobacter sp. AP-Capit-er-40B-B4]